jgi:hypothetical protein
MYLILTWVAVAIAAGRIIGLENAVEPSRFAPAPGAFGSDRDPLFTPTKAWPSKRPEPTPMFGSNDRSRWATVRALVDDGTFVIGKRADISVKTEPFPDDGIIFEDGWQSVDKVMNPATGEFYSTKPPLLSVMAASEYWLLQKLFGWKFNRDKWPIVIAILLTINVLPFACYLVLLARLIEQHGPNDFAKLFTFAAAAFGTFVLSFSTTLNNHTPALFCALFALYPLLRKRTLGSNESPAELFFSGLFAGLTATFELPAAAFAFGLMLLLLRRQPRTTLKYYLPGVLIPVLLLVVCNYWAMGRLLPAYGEFGGPWYKYPGSHWAKLDLPNPRGIDFNKQSTPVYAFNLLLGHHGWFSLTPVWVIGLFGLVLLAKRKPADDRAGTMRLFAVLTLVISVVVFAFYLTRTQSYNYGGNTVSARWLIWLSPLWLFGVLTGAGKLADSKWGTRFAGVCLGFSVVSVFYPMVNPWRSPWLLQLAESLNWIHYG